MADEIDLNKIYAEMDDGLMDRYARVLRHEDDEAHETAADEMEETEEEEEAEDEDGEDEDEE